MGEKQISTAYRGNTSHPGEPYVHKTWGNFKSSVIGDGAIGKLYGRQRDEAKKRFQRTLGGVSEDEAQEVMSKIVGLYNTWSDDNVGKTAEAVLLSNIKESVKNINETNIYSELLKDKIKDITSDMDKLNKAMDLQKQVMGNIEDVDKRILDYYTEKVNGSYSKFSNGALPVEGITTLSATGKVATSIKNWKRGWTKLEEAVNKSKTTGKGMQKTITMVKTSKSKGEVKGSRKVEKVVGDTIGQLNNIKGEILEVGLAALIRGSLNDFSKSINQDVKSATVSNQGADYVQDNILGKKVTKKTDVGIQFEVGKDGMKIDIGFSAKAQFKNGTTSQTKYLTSNYSKILERADLLDSYVEYNINNYIAHGRYTEALQMRKYVAAKMALIAVGGLERVDEVYFVAYLDKMVTLPDIFNNMMENSSNRLSLDIKNRSKAENQKFMSTAMERSHYTTNIIRKLSASISGRS